MTTTLVHSYDPINKFMLWQLHFYHNAIMMLQTFITISLTYYLIG